MNDQRDRRRDKRDKSTKKRKKDKDRRRDRRDQNDDTTPNTNTRGGESSYNETPGQNRADTTVAGELAMSSLQPLEPVPAKLMGSTMKFSKLDFCEFETLQYEGTSNVRAKKAKKENAFKLAKPENTAVFKNSELLHRFIFMWNDGIAFFSTLGDHKLPRLLGGKPGWFDGMKGTKNIIMALINVCVIGSVLGSQISKFGTQKG